MTYKQSVDYLYSLTADKLSFRELLSVLGRLGVSQDKFRIIHIAGTNGKGTTCCMIGSILAAAGYRVGAFTSPHLMRINERITINGIPVSDAEFAELANRVLDIGVSMTFFETLMVMAYLFFSEKKADIVIIETGIGGLLDCTNIIKTPLISIITRISYDHEKLLGKTITEISRQKAGIIKKNCPAVLYSNTRRVYNEIKKIADYKDAAFFYTGKPELKIESADISGSVFSVQSEFYDYENIRLSMYGAYHIENACGVLTAVHALKQIGVNIPKDAVITGLERAYMPGRMEIISKNPLVIVDGAHNENAAKAAAAALKNINKRIVLLYGVLIGKQNIIDHIPADTVIITRLTGGQEPRNIARSIDKHIIIIDDILPALQKALEIARTDACVFVAGSLRLAGLVKQVI